MIGNIIRTGFMTLRRDRGAVMLSFIVPIAFFSIFAGIFGSRNGGTNPIHMVVVDQDHSEFSMRFVKALEREPGLRIESVRQDSVESAEQAVKAGDVSVAVILPRGFGAAPISFSHETEGSRVQILNDSSDPIAAQVVFGLIQKAAMISMPDAMATEGTRMLDRYSGGLTPGQRARIDSTMAALRSRLDAAGDSAKADSGGGLSGGLIAADVRDVVGGNKKNPLVAFYAAGIGVMFLLFSASAAGGAMLDEADNGTLDRILSSRVTMTQLLLGKMGYAALLGFLQLTVMFLWGALVFRVELFRHLGGFLVMTTATALASAALGLALASACKTRAQLSSLTTLVVLVMSALGGSMVPRFIMPPLLQKIGFVTFNAWAIDGFTKIFWREEPVWHVWPQVLVLLGAAVALFLLARKLARRWEVA